MPEATYSTDTADVVSVWSAYGHRFIGTDSDTHEACLTCGAMYQLLALADDPSRGEYLTASGGMPAACTGDTSMVHGYPGERYCHEHDDPCEHTEHDCPCLFCDS